MFLPSNITLKMGDSGDFVAELQRRLARTGCFDENQVNGFFDNATAQGVIGFQSREGLHADGVAGPETLRRLNGVIAGDSSANSDKKEEEERAVAQAAITQDIMLTPPASEAAFNLFTETPPAHSPYGEEAYRAHAEPQPTPQPQQAPQPAPQPAVPEAQRQAELAAQQQQQQQHQPLPATPPIPAAELLNQLQAQQPPQPQQPSAPHPTELAATAAAPSMGAFVSAPQQQQAPAAPPAPAAEELQQQQQTGIVGKVTRFANSMMQKLSDYFEAKLPPSVLKEVQSIGVTMAASGMKEAPIPGGPELPSRGPELPSRGPDQAQQRG